MRSATAACLLISGSAAKYILPVRTGQWPQPKSGYVTPTENFLCVSGGSPFTIADGSKQACKESSPIATILEDLNLHYMTGAPDGPKVSACSGSDFINKAITVQYDKCEGAIKPDLDESYTLAVSKDGKIDVSAPNEYGVRHALQTLSNLIEARSDVFDAAKMDAENIYYVDPNGSNKWVFPYTAGITIQDEPRLPHRGLMIDTARTFITLDSIKETVKAMGIVKMNVLHWHLTDDQSFPALLDSNPTLMNLVHGPECAFDTKPPLESSLRYCKGLLSPDAYYRDQDITEVIDLAEAHGVRVVIEIDQPAHAASWAFANRTLLFYRGQTTREAFYETWGVLDLLNKGDEIWTDYGVPIMNHFMELARPGEYIHFGADEFPTGVFGPGNDEVKLVEPWLEKCITLIEKDNRKSIAWQDGLKSEAGKKHASVAAHIWDDATKAIEIANSGHDIIWSPATVMYVDCGRGNTVIPDLGSWCQPYTTWYEIYLQTPDLLIEGDKDYVGGDKAGIVLGGETALWNDARNREEQETGLWPRAAAWGGASWEARDEIPISAMVAEDQETLQKGIAHAVEAQQQLGHITRRIQMFTNLQVASFFQDYCLYKGSALCDSYIKVWYTENYQAKHPDEEVTTGGEGSGEETTAKGAAASLFGAAAAVTIVSAFVL